MCIDTPGFDDSTKTDSQILEEISRILTMQHEAGIALKGVIYLHRITDVRYAGSSVKTLEIFKRVCGSMALKNVMLVSTRWNDIDEKLGAVREQQLRNEFWAYMLGHGSTMARFHGSRESAIGIASQLLSRQSIVLELQYELLNEGKTLKQTAAGAYVNNDLAETKAQAEKELRDLESLRGTLRADDRVLQRKVKQDEIREQQGLQRVHEDEERLRREIAADVRAEMEAKKKKRGGGFWKMIPVLPALVGIIEMFVGIPPGSTSLLTSWFSESGFVETVSDFLGNL